MELLGGIPLSGGDFVIKLTTEECSLVAWALQLQADALTKAGGWATEPSRELSYQFAALSGDH